MKHIGTGIRVCALLLSALLCALSFASCGIITINKSLFSKDSDRGTDTIDPDASGSPFSPGGTYAPGGHFVPPDEYEYTGRGRAEAALSAINHSMNGASVFIYTSDDRVAASLDPGDDDYILSAAGAERKAMVEKALDCKLFFIRERPEVIAAKLSAAVMMDEYYADELIVPPRLASWLAAEGALYNLDALPFFSQDKEWFFQDSTELCAGYDTYGVYGPASLVLDDIECVIASGDGEKIDAVEKAALSGQWTWDMMLSMSADIDADALYRYGDVGIVDYTLVTEAEPENDETDADPDNEAAETEPADPEEVTLDDAERADAIASLVAASSGMHFVNHARGMEPTVYLPESIRDAAGIARRLINAVSGTASAPSEVSFHIGTLGEISSYATTDLEWTVLPLPKLTAEQENYASRTRSECVMCVPANTTDPDGAAAILNALGASSLFFEDEYVEYHMYSTVKRESTLPLISLICSTPSLDFARIFVNEGLTASTYDILFGLVTDDGFDADETFSKRESAANKYLSGRFGIGG